MHAVIFFAFLLNMHFKIAKFLLAFLLCCHTIFETLMMYFRIQLLINCLNYAWILLRTLKTHRS